MSTLNLDTFNEILFNAIKPEKRAELLEAEINMAYGIKIQKMEELVIALNECKPYHEILKDVNNIDANCDLLMAQLEKLRARGR